MSQLRTWVTLHYWQFVGCCWVVFCLLLVLIEILPRAIVVVDTRKEWKISEAEKLRMGTWEVKSLQLAQQTKVLEAQLDALYISVPRNDQMSVILDCLQKSSRDTGLSLQQIKTGTSVSKNTHEEQSISVIAKGTFHALGTFIDRIEQSPYLIKIKSLHIEREGKLKEELLAKLELQAIVVGR
ncbi:MAG: type 4a pilus biogenesis protein PilO [Rhodothermales bacterium]